VIDIVHQVFRRREGPPHPRVFSGPPQENSGRVSRVVSAAVEELVEVFALGGAEREEALRLSQFRFQRLDGRAAFVCSARRFLPGARTLPGNNARRNRLLSRAACRSK